MTRAWFSRVAAGLGLLTSWVGCGSTADEPGRLAEAVGTPSPAQVPLDSATIPKFAQELSIPPVFAPKVITDRDGNILRREYTVSVAPATVQMLPPGFPMTTVLAYGGQVQASGSSSTTFARTTPGPTFENIRGIPNIVHWDNQITTPAFLPVDPTIHWANPNAVEAPLAPFNAFPSGYADAQFPVAHVTHTHGLMVPSEFDGTAEQWFTAFGDVGPTFVDTDYWQPNDQPPTQLWYHGHTMGVTRLDFYAGLVGNYFLRDPNNPLDQPTSPLPSGPYEIPLVIQDRGFFTDGELNFPRTGLNPQNPYWTVALPTNTQVVNGKVWPNLNVEPRQYRFRILIAPNERLYTLTFSNNMPFTIIGSDGGYLPAPQVVTSQRLGGTERADVLVDFSSFTPGTKIQLLDSSADVKTLGTIMQFTVTNAQPVPPPSLPASLNALPTLVADAPARNKVLNLVRDDGGNVKVLIDGLHFTQPAIDYPLVGSTEQWNLIQNSPVTHMIHLHLIEFQVLGRQALNTSAYNQRWLLVNGMPHLRSRPIFVDPTPFYIGAPIPPSPYETGWKDSVQATGNQITRILARWAPQEIPTGGSTPGVNQFSIDPTSGPGYLIHCHITGHEDHDMLRKMPLVNAWMPGTHYRAGTVVAYQSVDYRVLVGHRSRPHQPPTARFDLWERVDNNDGSWAPQITYAVDDRVLFQGRLFTALQLHQAQTGLEPTAAPQLWRELPLSGCGQLAQFCAGNSSPNAVKCLATGQAGVEATCLAQLSTCLAACQPELHNSPCSGLCANPTTFSVPNGSSYQSGNLGTLATCYETLSQIRTGSCTSFSEERTLTVNGVSQSCDGTDWPAPLPPQRNEGYCIQATAGGDAAASFTMHH